jgi:hypothetical protein
MFIGSPLLVREPTSFSNKGGKQDGYQQQETHSHASLRQYQGHDLAE